MSNRLFASVVALIAAVTTTIIVLIIELVPTVPHREMLTSAAPEPAHLVDATATSTPSTEIAEPAASRAAATSPAPTRTTRRPHPVTTTTGVLPPKPPPPPRLGDLSVGFAGYCTWQLVNRGRNVELRAGIITGWTGPGGYPANIASMTLASGPSGSLELAHAGKAELVLWAPVSPVSGKVLPVPLYIGVDAKQTVTESNESNNRLHLSVTFNPDVPPPNTPGKIRCDLVR